MDNKKGSGCAAPIIVFLVIMGISVLLQAVWTPTIPDFKTRLEINNKIGTWGWIAAIAIPSVIFIYNYVTARSIEKQQKEQFLRQDISNSRKKAREQIINLNACITGGNEWKIAIECDHAVENVWTCQTVSGAFEYMRTIEDANLLYLGNKYPELRHRALEDAVTEEINRIPGSHFKA